MENQSQQSPQPPPGHGGEAPAVRFEATVHTGAKAADLDRVADLDLDRVPDPEGAVRLLLTTEDLQRLLDAGYEVRLQQSLSVQPLDPNLVADDDSVQAWLEEQVQGADRTEDG